MLSAIMESDRYFSFAEHGFEVIWGICSGLPFLMGGNHDRTAETIVSKHRGMKNDCQALPDCEKIVNPILPCRADGIDNTYKVA